MSAYLANCDFRMAMSLYDLGWTDEGDGYLFTGLEELMAAEEVGE